MMTRVCWLVRSFVGWFAMLVVSSIFIIFGTDVERQKSKTILTFQKSRSNFKVKTAVLKMFKS